VRITLPDKREIDCLQKVHALGSSVIGGFAGSVTIGLDVLALLNAMAPPRTGWDLGAVMAMWPPRVIRHRFSLHSQELRSLAPPSSSVR
jgi:hypothetical protein